MAVLQSHMDREWCKSNNSVLHRSDVAWSNISTLGLGVYILGNVMKCLQQTLRDAIWLVGSAVQGIPKGRIYEKTIKNKGGCEGRVRHGINLTFRVTGCRIEVEGQGKSLSTII